MNNILLIVIITLFVIGSLTQARMLVKLSKAQKMAAKLLINNVVLEEYINNLEGNNIQNDESVHKENFIKFLSDSRDWAYTYIEDVQDGIAKFVDSVEDDIKHFDEYGDVLATNRPDYEAMKRFSEAYKELKKLLPEEEIK